MRLDLINGLWEVVETTECWPLWRKLVLGDMKGMGYVIAALSSICFPGCYELSCFPLSPALAMLKDPENGQVKQRTVDWMDGTFEIISPSKLVLLKVAHVKGFVITIES